MFFSPSIFFLKSKMSKRTLDEESTDSKKQKTAVSIESWRSQLDLIAKSGASKDQICEAFETYLKIYVNDGLVVSKFIDYLLSLEDLDKTRIEKIFSEKLTKVLNVQLWKSYLKYIIKINPILPDSPQIPRETILNSFKFAIESLGMDPLNGHLIYQDYLNYLYNWKPLNSSESTNRTELIELTLIKMIQTPSLKLEDNWKLFTSYCNELNSPKGKKLINDHSNQYMKLRSINNELKSIICTKANQLKLVEVLDTHHSKQLKIWQKWIKWEITNPLSLDSPNLRLNLIYNLSCQYLKLVPMTWFNYSMFLLIEMKSPELARNTLTDSLKINSSSLSLCLKLSEIYQNDYLDDSNEANTALLNSLWSQFIENLISQGRDGYMITKMYIYWLNIWIKLSNLKEIRNVFGQARKFSAITYHVYKEYALFEYSVNDNIKIANKTFELGLKNFPNNINIILEYLEFLIKIKDLKNFKKVIEISINDFEAEDDLLELFKCYYKVETLFGNFNSTNLLTERFLKKFPKYTAYQLMLLNDENGDLTQLDQCQNNEDEEEASDNENENDTGNDARFAIPDGIYNLLRILPNSESFNGIPSPFDIDKSIDFFKTVTNKD